MANKKMYAGFHMNPERKEVLEALARATGLSRSEFLRRAVVVAERHLDEIRAQGEPDDPRSEWKH